MSENYEQLRLDNQLCFPLYACAREVVKAYKPYLDEIGLTYTQYVTMLVMWEEGETTSKRLGRRLYLDSGTLTPVLKRLEEKGLIERSRLSCDERNLSVKLTPAGEALKHSAAAVPARMAACLKLEQAEAETLAQLLRKLLDSFSE